MLKRISRFLETDFLLCPVSLIDGFQHLGDHQGFLRLHQRLGARSIGVAAPVRESGDIAGSGACKLVGPAGEIEITEGVIAAKRHIHATTADAERIGVENGEIVSVEIPSANSRNLVFGDVVVRVSDSYALAMHIDTDESNAAGMAPNTIGRVIKQS